MRNRLPVAVPTRRRDYIGGQMTGKRPHSVSAIMFSVGYETYVRPSSSYSGGSF